MKKDEMMRYRIIPTAMNGIVTIAVWLLQPIGPLHPTQPPSIPDKVEIMFCRQPDADSLHHRLDIVEKKLTEMTARRQKITADYRP
jgi:hypothetical protein